MTSERRQRIAGVVLLFGLVYVAFELTAALAWVNPPYDWAYNYISDLGFSDCATVDGDRICSPLHPLMNAGFLVQGTIFTIGSILVAGLIVRGRVLRLVVTALLVISGVGTFFVGIFHQSLALSAAGLNDLHVLSAFLAIGPGNVGLLLLGISAIGQAEWRGYGIAVAIIAVIGIIGSLFLLAGNGLGIGPGFIERVAVYPLNTWTIGTGIGLTVKSVRDRNRRVRATKAEVVA